MLDFGSRNPNISMPCATHFGPVQISLFLVIVLSFLHHFLCPHFSHSRADTDLSPAFIFSVFFGKTEGSDWEDGEDPETCCSTKTRSFTVGELALITQPESGETTIGAETGSPPTLRFRVGLQFVITRYCLVTEEASARIKKKTTPKENYPKFL